jgi:hypothetical protein
VPAACSALTFPRPVEELDIFNALCVRPLCAVCPGAGCATRAERFKDRAHGSLEVATVALADKCSVGPPFDVASLCDIGAPERTEDLVSGDQHRWVEQLRTADIRYRK